MRWLTDILKDGTLKDNRSYRIVHEDGKYMFKPKTGNGLKLETRGKYSGSNNYRKPSEVFSFLKSALFELNNLVQSKKKDIIYLNTSEYEHNTDDPFAKLNGINEWNYSLEIGNVIGFVKKGDYAINISSRFGDNFLKYIISDTDGFLEIEDFGGNDNAQTYEWLVLYLWKIKLKKAFRLGLPKAYITKTNSSSKVRGSIDVQDYFLNPNSGNYKCTFREHSYNIDVNHLITAVFKKHKKNSLFKDMLMMRNAFNTATEGIRTSKLSLLNTPHFSNPFYSTYNDIINLSKLILKEELADFGETSNLNAYLFDVSMLFEYFIRKLLRNLGCDLQDKFSDRLSIPAGSMENYTRKLEPDIVFQHDDKTYVFDVKYKSYDFRYGVKREDLFQLHSYLGQYCNKKSQVASCGFIYPLSEDKWNEKVKTNNGFILEELEFSGKKVAFCVCFIKIPKTTNSNDWKTYKEQFKTNCGLFTDNFMTQIIKSWQNIPT